MDPSQTAAPIGNASQTGAQPSNNSNALIIIVVLVLAGFLLIVGVIVVGVLVFIVSSPGPPAEIVCMSSDPAKIMLKASDVPYLHLSPSSPLGTIKLQNLTGGDLTNISCTGSNAFAANVPGCPTTVKSGAEINLTPIAGSTGTHSLSKIEIKYTDAFGNSKTATIACSGPLNIS
jgi:hypothetical protein